MCSPTDSGAAFATAVLAPVPVASVTPMLRRRLVRRRRKPDTGRRHLATPAAQESAWRRPPCLPANTIVAWTAATMFMAMMMAVADLAVAVELRESVTDGGAPSSTNTCPTDKDGNPLLGKKTATARSSSGMSAAEGEGESGEEDSAKRLYLVSLNNLPPVSMYAGGATTTTTTARTVSTLASSSSSSAASASSFAVGGGGGGGSSSRPQFHTTAARTYAAHLVDTHSTVLDAAGIPRSARVASYKYIVNGFGAMLTQEEASELRQQMGVAAVRRSRRYRPFTDNSPKFLRLSSSLWQASGGMDNAGEDVIIGVLDSGIWPEHPSFRDNTVKAYGPVPPRWRGTCSITSDFTASNCNRKLIGAQHFAQGWIVEEGFVDTRADYFSPRDVAGHGTWCAGAAAGNSRVNASLGGSVVGQISGMAPRARVAMYKVCWQNSQTSYCTGLDILSALDKATADGVDIISMSLGDRAADDFFGPDELGLLRTWLAGVVLVVAAGNAGNTALFDPVPQVSYTGPWCIVVAASTANRTQTVSVRLGDGSVLAGLGFVAGNENTVARRLVLSSKCAWDPSSSMSISNANLCFPGSLDPGKCGGAIVICTRGTSARVEKAEVVKAAGGAGFILINQQSNMSPQLADAYAVPGLLLTLEQGNTVRNYVSRVSTPTATILPYPPAPMMASFSSRGPVVDPANDTVLYGGPSPHTMKPDITAPGVDLLGAWVQDYANQDLDSLDLVLSGTSMATPHVAGLAALLRQQYPAWAPAHIKSAIMTTASQVDNSGQPIKTSNGATPANPSYYGAGHVNPLGMLNPGLVYDAGQTDYYNFLAGIDYTAALSLPGVTPMRNTQATAGYNLNEPYIWVARLRGTVNVTRRVVNVAGTNAVFTARVVAPAGVTVVVAPPRLQLARNASALFSVRLTARTSTREFRYGSLTWIGGASFAVRSVIAVQPLSTS